MKPQLDKQFILRSLSALAKKLGRAPSRREFLPYAGLSEHALLRCFTSWSAALQAAGLEPDCLSRRLDQRKLLEDWGRLARKHGKVPSRRVYDRFGKFDHRSLTRRFGSWSALPKVFREFAGSKPEWSDVVALLSSSASRRQAANVRHHALRNRLTYGAPMDFRGLRHEPVNEQGVLLLFGMVAKELGYIVESVQSGFPDCEAKRQIAPGRWQCVHLEFEFESRNYREHGHPLDGCDVIVCWRHNWPDHPQHLEILELSSLLPTLPATAPSPIRL